MEVKINSIKPHYENFDAKSLDIDYTVSFGLMALNGVIEDVGSDDIGKGIFKKVL